MRSESCEGRPSARPGRSVTVLVFNCGSSSLKYSLLSMPTELQLARGEAQRVGPRTAEPGRIVHRGGGREITHFADMADHQVAFVEVMRLLAREGYPLPDVIGHRLVHGGRRFTGASAIVDAAAERDLDEVAELAPIHNPPAIALVRACRRTYPELRQVLVFDTSFHSTIPPHAAQYALPATLRAEHGFRKFGFHGISHQYVVTEAARLLGRPLRELRLVSCHLGSGGASLCAVVGGVSVDNTMGYSPLQGLIMSTRCGDLDPALTLQLLARHEGDPAAVESLLNRQSGVLGLSATSADVRDLVAALARGEGSHVPLEIYLWRLRKYLGAYLTVTAPADAIILTDTIGETVPFLRSALCSGLGAFGVHVDEERNARATHVDHLPLDLATYASPVRVLAIATNEELAIARATSAASQSSPHRAEVLH